ncbi:hypothetical protein AB0F49_14080 [Micromonospora ureilytica]|uniref:hypothetical protein n=1 Tax=Micromonospora ureilytica TaxID=709868 RepID=UPI00340337B4
MRLERAAAAAELGDGPQAVARHEKAIGRDGWRWLPVEHRATHLIDGARAYLQTDDPHKRSASGCCQQDGPPQIDQRVSSEKMAPILQFRSSIWVECLLCRDRKCKIAEQGAQASAIMELWCLFWQPWGVLLPTTTP